MIQQPQTSYPQLPQMAQMTPPPQMAQPQYNAVKIDIINPTASPGNAQPFVPQIAPTYQYPQAPMYQYPQAPLPVAYKPVQIPAPVVPQPSIQQPPAPPAPVIQEQPVTAQPAEVKPAVAEPTKLSDADAKSFTARLSAALNKPTEQETVIKEIATLVQADKQKAEQLLDDKLIEQLLMVVDQKTPDLKGPMPEQIELRQQIKNGQKVTPEQQVLADKLSEAELEIRNKQYALYTVALLDKVLIDEVKKQGQPMTANKIPGIAGMIDTLKTSQYPDVREAAAAAIEHIAAPEFKADLAPIMEKAKQDSSPDVQKRVDAVMAKLNAQPSEALPAQQQQVTQAA